MRALMAALTLPLLLAGTAFGDWESLDDLPEVVEVRGRSFVYGGNHIWAVYSTDFGNWLGEDWETALYQYYPEDDDWDYLWDCEGLLKYPAITYLPYHNQLFFIGEMHGVHDTLATLFRYDIATENLWDDELPFALGPGAALVYRPGPIHTHPLHGGWVYCFPGYGRGFWRYSLPEFDDQDPDGMSPPCSSVITHTTPPFQWPASKADGACLVLARDPDFRDIVFDVRSGISFDQQAQIASYRSETPLAPGEYWWKAGVLDTSGIPTWTTRGGFDLEQVGWAELDSLPFDAGAGASLARDNHNYYDLATNNLLALPGDGSNAYWRYCVGADTWIQMGTTPYAQNVDGHMTTPAAGLGDNGRPWAMFGGGSGGERRRLYQHDNALGWQLRPELLPARPRAGAALTIAPAQDSLWLYYVEGGGTDYHDRLYIGPSGFGDGGQSGPTLPVAASARIIGRGNELSLQYRLHTSGPVRVLVCDVAGRIKATLYSGVQPAGAHELRWDPKSSGTAAGAYIIILDAGPQQARLKAVVR